MSDEIKPTKHQATGGEPSGETEAMLEQAAQMFGKKEAAEEPEPEQEVTETPEPTPEPELETDDVGGEEGKMEVPSFDEFVTEVPIEKEEEEPPAEPEPPKKDTSKETNIKNLRNIIKTVESKLQRANQRIEELTTEHAIPEDYKEKLASLEARNQQLEQYEYMYALEQNPTFKSKYVDGVNNLLAEAKQIGIDYEVDPEVVEQLAGTKNSKQLNKLLREYVDDDDAISDLKGIFKKIHHTQAEAESFKQEAQTSLAKFREAEGRVDTEKKEVRNKRLNKHLKTGWLSALHKNRSIETPIYELMEVPGNTAHNEKIVKPLLKEAGKATTNIVSHIERLINTGGEVDLPFVEYISTLVQQGMATQMLNQSRAHLIQKQQELQKGLEEDRSFSRPGLDTMPRNGVGGAKKPAKEKYKGMRPDEWGKKAAADIASSVLSGLT